MNVLILVRSGLSWADIVQHQDFASESAAFGACRRSLWQRCSGYEGLGQDLLHSQGRLGEA